MTDIFAQLDVLLDLCANTNSSAQAVLNASLSLMEQMKNKDQSGSDKRLVLQEAPDFVPALLKFPTEQEGMQSDIAFQNAIQTLMAFAATGDAIAMTELHQDRSMTSPVEQASVKTNNLALVSLCKISQRLESTHPDKATTIRESVQDMLKIGGFAKPVARVQFGLSSDSV